MDVTKVSHSNGFRGPRPPGFESPPPFGRPAQAWGRPSRAGRGPRTPLVPWPLRSRSPGPQFAGSVGATHRRSERRGRVGRRVRSGSPEIGLSPDGPNTGARPGPLAWAGTPQSKAQHRPEAHQLGSVVLVHQVEAQSPERDGVLPLTRAPPGRIGRLARRPDRDAVDAP
jgi:hypothetical protein